MNYKIEEYDYSRLMEKITINAELSKEMDANIAFVEKYIDSVDSFPLDSKEKQIVYRQLGSIVFSCVEALIKSFILEIKRRCAKRNCKERCHYNAYNNEKKLTNASVIELLDYFNKIRLISVIPYELFKIEELRDMRNYIHIFRGISEDAHSRPFDKKYVEDNLQLYYVLLNQLESNTWFFDKEDICLKEMDSDDFVETSNMVDVERKDFYTINIYNALIKIMYNNKIQKDDYRFLSLLSKKDKYDKLSLAHKIGDGLYFNSAYYKTDCDFNKSKERLYKTIQEYAKDNELIDLIKKEYLDAMKRYNKK